LQERRDFIISIAETQPIVEEQQVFGLDILATEELGVELALILLDSGMGKQVHHPLFIVGHIKLRNKIMLRYAILILPILAWQCMAREEYKLFPFTLHKVHDKEARCMDGSDLVVNQLNGKAFYYAGGYKEGAKKFIIMLQGGGYVCRVMIGGSVDDPMRRC
jgi:hypothetical protein